MPPVRFEVNNYVSPPKLRLQIWSGRLNTSSCTPQYKRSWNLGTLRRNTWYNFVFHVRWSSSRLHGYVRVKVNGRVVVPLTRVATLYSGQGVYLKQGFYRGQSKLTTTLYHDGLQRFRP